MIADTHPYQLAFEASGVRVGLLANTPEILAGIREIWVPSWRECAAEGCDQSYVLTLRADGSGTLEIDGELLGRVEGVEALVEDLYRHVHIGIGADSPEFVFLHGGAVSWQGKGLLLPGPSFAGKSTLTHALTARGAVYYSDDLALLDGKGLLQAYPRSLGLREGPDGPRRIPARAIGWNESVESVPVALVATLRYEPGAGLTLTTTSPGTGALAMLANTVTAENHTQRAVDAIAEVARRARFVTGQRGEAGPAAVALLDMLDDIGS